MPLPAFPGLSLRLPGLRARPCRAFDETPDLPGTLEGRDHEGSAGAIVPCAFALGSACFPETGRHAAVAEAAWRPVEGSQRPKRPCKVAVAMAVMFTMDLTSDAVAP